MRIPLLIQNRNYVFVETVLLSRAAQGLLLSLYRHSALAIWPDHRRRLILPIAVPTPNFVALRLQGGTSRRLIALNGIN